MNQLRDVWRIRWCHMEAGRPGYLHEGLWTTPYETSANMATQDAAVWLATGFTIPGQDESYPVVREVVAYRMDGDPQEVARARVTKAGMQRPFRLDDGTEIDSTSRPDGRALETEDGWTKVRKY